MSAALLDWGGSLAVVGWVDSLGTGAGRVHQPGEMSIRRRGGKGTGLVVPLLRMHGDDTPGFIVYRSAITRVLYLDRRVAVNGLGPSVNDRCQGCSEGLEDKDDWGELVPVTPVHRKVVLPQYCARLLRHAIP